METRDKLFTEEQYRKQLAGYSKRCKQLESSIMEIINAEKEHIGVYCLHEHSEQTGKFVLGHPYVAVLYLYTDDGLFILVFQTGDGDVSSIFHKALFLNGVTI